MQVGISFNLSASHGALKMAVKERGVVIEGLDIELSGGMGSWLYNWSVTTLVPYKPFIYTYTHRCIRIYIYVYTHIYRRMYVYTHA